MQWLSGLPFGDNQVVQIGLAAASGVFAVAVLAAIYRFVFAHRLRVPGGRTRQPRLGLVDAFSLDGQRQLVLVRRDNVEHLIMIGGPNDVLLESQINRALAPVRENNNLAPAATPPPPATRPAPVAVPAAPAARALPPQSTPASTSEVAPAEARQSRPPLAAAPSAGTAMPETRPSAPAAPSTTPIPAKIPSPPATPSAPAAISAPSAPAAAQRAAVAGPAASAGPAPPKAVEAHRPTLATRPPPLPLPQRSAMPPPIAPGVATNRGNVTRLPEKHPQGSAAATSNGFPTGPNSRPQTADAAAEPEVVRAGTEPGPAGVKPEVRITPQAAPKAPSPPAEAPMSVEPEPPAGAPRREPPGPTPPAQPLGADQAASAPARTPAKAEDPFAGLESLEAEMARLLGREK